MAAIVLTCTFESVAAVQSDSSDHGPTPATQSPDKAVSSEKAPTEAAGAISLLLPAVGIGAVALIVWRRWYRLEMSARPIPPSWPAYAAMLLGGYLLLGMLGNFIAAQWMGLEPTTAMKDLTFTQQVTLQGAAHSGPVLVVIAAVLMWRRHPQAGLASRLGGRTAAGLAAAAIIIAFPVVTLANSIGALIRRAITDQSPELIAHSTLQLLVDNRDHLAMPILLGLVLVVVPIVEEVIYRGIIQRTATGLGVRPWTAIAATSAVFALMHGGAIAWHVMPGLFVLSLAFGWAYHKTGRLMAPILMHIAFNSINVALALIV